MDAVLCLVYNSIESKRKDGPHHGRQSLIIEKLGEFDPQTVVVIVLFFDIHRPGI